MHRLDQVGFNFDRANALVVAGGYDPLKHAAAGELQQRAFLVLEHGSNLFARFRDEL